MTQKHTYDFGLIGNCAYQAHIGKDTNIAWMCWPRFDSSFIFGGLLDKKKGGQFSILPVEAEFTSKQYYEENTNVLCTEITTESGTYKVTDFAPRFLQFERYFKPIMLIRKVEPISGNPKVKIRCEPKGDYGKVTPKSYHGSNHIEFLGMERDLRLTTNIPLNFILEDRWVFLNDTKYMVLTYGAPLEAPLGETCEDFLKKTILYWQKWVKHMTMSNFSQKQIIRSALVLKIHQYEDTGAIIAAGTTSLPESPGSTRNWDYRYCWLRDAYYTLAAFNYIGHFEELENYFNFIINVSDPAEERYQPLYTITAGSNIEEVIMDLEGYLGNQPVRVGNQAYTHIQNDVYGQILLALLPLYVDDRFINGVKKGSLVLIFELLKKIDRLMDEPDAGLWEFRTLEQYHCYTYLFHWAGAQAAWKIGKAFGNNKMMQQAKALIKRATAKIEACYDPELGAYTQAIGTKNMDASNLQLICMGYLDPKSRKTKLHLEALEKELKTPEGLFYRYMHKDDFGKPDTTFLICAFWYVEALATVGRVKEAIATFEKLISYANHLGLLSEDVEASTGSQWGNFPQAYSHVGLVNAAYRISNRLDKPNFL